MGGCHLLLISNVAGSLLILDSFFGQVFLRQLQSNDSTPTVKKPHNDVLLDQVCLYDVFHFNLSNYEKFLLLLSRASHNLPFIS